VDLGPGGWRALAVLAFAGTVAFTLPQSSSVAPSPSEPGPSPTPGLPTLDGEVTGGGQAGRPLEIRVEASVPGGWDRLHLVEAVLLVDGEPVDELRYDIEDAKVSLGDLTVVAGTGASATGEYLKVAGSRIALTTGGANLSLLVDADVVTEIPDGARFELGVVGDRGETVSITRSLEAPPVDTGPTWASVITAILVALLAGGFVGNVFASRRRPPVRPSVYATIERRLETDRRSGGAR
jgi:hypothetical protein